MAFVVDCVFASSEFCTKIYGFAFMLVVRFSFQLFCVALSILG